MVEWKEFFPDIGVKINPLEGVFVVLNLRDAIWGMVYHLAEIPTRGFRRAGFVPLEIDEISFGWNSTWKGNLNLIS